MPTLVLERLRAVGEAAAVPKKPLSGGADAAATEADAEERVNSPKVGGGCESMVTAVVQSATPGDCCWWANDNITNVSVCRRDG